MKKIFVMALLTTASIVTLGQTHTAKITKTPEEKLNEEYCSGLFRLADGTILDLVNSDQNAQGYLNILDWLEGRVAGLQVFTSRTGVRVPFIRGSYAKIYVDEIAIDAGFLNTLPVSDIAMIKVIKGLFAGNAGGGGAIAIYTIKGDYEEEDQE